MFLFYLVRRQDVLTTNRAISAVKKKMKPKPRKPISGAEGRKRRRERLSKGVANGTVNLIRMPYVGRLKTVQDWGIQAARIYRRMCTGEIPEYIGTKLIYAVTSGASIAKIIADMRHEERMRIAFERAVEAGLIDRNVLMPSLGGEYLPKDSDEEEDDDPMIRKRIRSEKCLDSN
jgi:hypothetical protein